mmetsp:Transcript_20621/g.38377  ORF Transcript_20621/g.38377 Transcript_20621/m.38377 type:complete len:232 (-) Transcript_20621:238-933(-)
MGITALGARKIILKEVTRLRRCARLPAGQITRPLTPSSGPGGSRRSFSQDTEKRAVIKDACPVNKIQETNENRKAQVQSQAYEALDEEREHEAFRAAVAEWRSGTSTHSSTPAPQVNSSESKDSGGVLLAGHLDEEAEHRAFKHAVNIWRKSGSEVEIIDAQKHKEDKETHRALMLNKYEECLKRSKPVLDEASPRGLPARQEHQCYAEGKTGEFNPRPASFEEWQFDSAF